MPHSVAKFLYTGTEAQALERVDWFGRYRRMRLLERTEHSMTMAAGVRLVWGEVFLRVTTRPEGNAADVTLEAWATDWAGGEWNADPRQFRGAVPHGIAWECALSLAAYLGVAQPEKLFVHPSW